MDVEKGKLVKEFQNWGNVYSIQFNIVVTKLSSQTWTNVFHFSGTKKNCCGLGDRIPGLWINRGSFFRIVSTVNKIGNFKKNIPFELGKLYHVNIQQSKIDEKYWYEILIDGETKLKIENFNPLSFSSVKFYASDPWHSTFTSDFGQISGVTIING